MSGITIQRPEESSISQTSTPDLAMLFIICFVCSVLGGTVSTLMSVYLPVVIKELLGDLSPEQLSNISGYINAIFILGWAAGAFTWRIISDKIGRKKAFVYAVACYGIFTILTGFMPQLMGLVLCRFMSGFGIGGELVVAFTLINEVWPNKSKALFTSILLIAFPVGIFSAGFINYILSSWRVSFFIGIIPITFAILGAIIISESEVWKSRKRDKNNTGTSLFSTVNSRDVIVGSIMLCTIFIGLWAVFSWLPTWVQSLFATDAPKERGLSIMFLGIGGLAGIFFSGWLIKLMGITRSMLLCAAVCAALSFILFKTNDSFSAMIYVEIAIMALFFGASQGVLSAFVPRLFHKGIRATVTRFRFNAESLFTVLMLLFIGIVTTLSGYGNAILISLLVFFAGLIVVFFIKDKITNEPISEAGINN